MAQKNTLVRLAICIGSLHINSQLKNADIQVCLVDIQGSFEEEDEHIRLAICIGSLHINSQLKKNAAI